MGRSQRHMVFVQNYPANGEAGSEGQPSPGYLMQMTPEPPNLRRSLREVAPTDIEDVYVPEGPRGGPLQGSSMAGAIPEVLVPDVPGSTAPTIGALDPETAVLGSADITMHVRGGNFTEESVIVFNGGDETTTFVSATDLTTIVKPSTASVAGAFPVQVRNADDQLSNEWLFSFTENGTPDVHGYPLGPFAILHVKPHTDPAGANYVLASADGKQVHAGDAITVEATGNSATNGNFTVTTVDVAGGQTHVIVEDVEVAAQIDAKGRMTVTGGA